MMDELATDFDELDKMYPNQHKDTAKLRETLASLKEAVAEVERLVAEDLFGEELAENLIDCMHMSCGLAAMYFKDMDDFVSSNHFDEQGGYGYSFITLTEPFDELIDPEYAPVDDIPSH